MTQDPIQPLADVGRRVLQTVRYLAIPPVPNQPLESYESQLRDPVVALSGICNELLEQLAAAPVTAEPENLPNEPGSRFLPAPNPASAFPRFSRAGAAGIPADGRGETADSLRENQATERPDTTGLEGTSPFEESRRSIDDPARSQDEPGAAATQADGPAAQPLRPATDGSDLPPTARQTARRAPSSRNMQHPVGPEPSPEESSSETRPPEGQEWPEIRQTELPSDARASDIPARTENGAVREVGESDVPLHDSRLTGSTERLAAMLRSHVAQPEPVTRAGEKESQEGKDVFSSRQGGDESDASNIMVQPGRTRLADRIGIEEIMERLTDELETEFVRTYGSSGG